ncbi:RusA family crossover junction endodeoxyribonuclease [Pseudomonas viridiflava]|uniref:RusA family crossover junction endodeoxyribonuclease n=1 Tax=Pseudomonas viridiflava TaxID=33069 RepID=UPI000F061739|nr:RusA family crossover junction endodeoxyribonuclease [Pseudomonas viridiflava]
MTIPIEFTVLGNPSSVNSTSGKKAAWKTLVEAAAKGAVALHYPGKAKSTAALTVKVFYFPINQQYIDVDNGLKHTIDGLATAIFENDKAVTRIITERFPPVPKASLLVPIGFAREISSALMIANGAGNSATGAPLPKQHATAVKVEPYVDSNGKFW